MRSGRQHHRGGLADGDRGGGRAAVGVGHGVAVGAGRQARERARARVRARAPAGRDGRRARAPAAAQHVGVRSGRQHHRGGLANDTCSGGSTAFGISYGHVVGAGRQVRKVLLRCLTRRYARARPRISVWSGAAGYSQIDGARAAATASYIRYRGASS